MAKSKIEWTTNTWNPIVGCSILSPGCTNCYAMKMAARIQRMNRTRGTNSNYVNHYDGTTKAVNGNVVWTGKLALAPDKLFLNPLSRKAPTTYFVNSMGDLFHEDVPDEWIDKVFAVMALCPQHMFQVLTKRAGRMRKYFALKDRPLQWVLHACQIGKIVSCYDVADADTAAGWHFDGLPNVWLGVSTERQQEADERIPLLLQTPAAVRFISAEPLLGPIDLRQYLDGHEHHGVDMAREVGSKVGACIGWTPPLDWVIVGGESGPNARPMHPDWARNLRDQCAAAGVPFFFKQWGEWADTEDWPSEMQENLELINRADGNNVRVGKKRAGRKLDGVEHSQMPEHGA